MGFKTVFIITISTLRMVFPGIAPTADLTARDQSGTIPATRSVGISLYSGREAGQSAYAVARIPSGLGLGGRAPLTIDRRASAKEPEEAVAGAGAKTSHLSQKTYWGCGDSIAQGQPRGTTTSAAASSGFEALPNKSVAYWAGPPRGALPDEAEPRGLYTLDTSFAGATSVSVGADQAFLPAVNIVSDTSKLDLNKPMQIEWGPVAGALGYLVTAFGGTADVSINWTSSADPDAAHGMDARALSDEELGALLGKGVLLPATATSCTIPGGAFSGSLGAMISVTAFGRDKIQEKNGIETRVVVRSNATVALMPPNPAAR